MYERVLNTEAATGSVLKNFTKLTGKHLCQSLFIIKCYCLHCWQKKCLYGRLFKNYLPLLVLNSKPSFITDVRMVGVLRLYKGTIFL